MIKPKKCKSLFSNHFAQSSISANLPHSAEIRARREDSSTVYTWDLVFTDPTIGQSFSFTPGQFNMLYLLGVGEVAISISSDPDDTAFLSHTIRAVGRITKAMQTLDIGDQIGVRGPYGNGWPIDAARGKDVVIVTGGLGCAPTVSVIRYILARREHYGTLTILQGVKHSDDMIYRQQYAAWEKAPRTQIVIAADYAGPHWPWRVGFVTDSIQALALDPDNTIVMMCGPEGMMKTAAQALTDRGVEASNIYLSMERNMVCGMGHCGHCQYGGFFICKEGPVLAYSRIKALLSETGI